MAEIKVTNTLFIRTWDIENSENGLDIIDPTSHGMGTAGVFGHELPALLNRLQEAAEAMQIPTKQGEMVKALKEAHAYMVDRMPTHALGVIEQAIAKAEQ